jgi:preprotein translocase subunit YajC
MTSLQIPIAMMSNPNAQGQSGGMGGMLVPMLLIMAIFYFMMIRPQQRKEKERRAMLDAVKSGDRVVFGGGMIGTVANIKDQTLVIKIADSVKVEVLRGSITRVVEKDEKIAEEN